jgi:hypothetical protein
VIFNTCFQGFVVESDGARKIIIFSKFVSFSSPFATFDQQRAMLVKDVLQDKCWSPGTVEPNRNKRIFPAADGTFNYFFILDLFQAELAQRMAAW